MAGKKTSLLLIEDNIADKRLIEEYLKKTENFDFSLSWAETLSSGVSALSSNNTDIILLDLSLPDSKGIDTIKKILGKAKTYPVVILTGFNDLKTAKEAMDLGVQDYLVKNDISSDSLYRSIHYSIERKKTEIRLRNSEKFQRTLIKNLPVMQYNISLEGNIISCNDLVLKTLGYGDEKELVGKHIFDTVYAPSSTEEAKKCFKQWKDTGIIINEELQVITKDKKILDVLLNANTVYDDNGKPLYSISTHQNITEKKKVEKDLLNSQKKLSENLKCTLETLSAVIENRDPYTNGHQKKVAEISEKIARKLKLREDQIENIRTAALIHDIGKISIPISILSKPGKISDIEFSLIKSHPEISYNIIKRIDFPVSVKKIVLQHHERLDGSGYPKGLKSKDILRGAKILAVADVMEAMSSHRPYRPARSTQEVKAELTKHKKTLYDPQIVDIALKMIEEKSLPVKIEGKK